LQRAAGRIIEALLKHYLRKERREQTILSAAGLLASTISHRKVAMLGDAIVMSGSEQPFHYGREIIAEPRSTGALK
jgi:hypothetical protein